MVLLDLGSDIVTPPWLPLVLVGVLLAILGFLYWSLRHHLQRIDFPEPPAAAESVPDAGTPPS